METYIPKNSINTPLQLSEDELVEKLLEYQRENARLRNNNETYKLQYIEMREKLKQLLETTKI
tara:strand:- start:945 stop:1133 length:189 start_codon:yes stop_codon:yes gene_type:complete